MEIKNFEHKRTGEPELMTLVRQARENSTDILESVGAGFDFPVPEKIRKINKSDVLETNPATHESISKTQLIKTALHSLKAAWEKAILPQIGNIRAKGVETVKEGMDFFTKADKDSEQVIKNIFNQEFGENNIQIFGEETNIYTGNLDSSVSVRIDPIDGTESFKFGKQNWGIMVGVYEGKIGSEKQIISATLFPELNVLMYRIEGVGVFVGDLESGRTKEISEINDQDNLKNLIVSYYKHSDVKQRGDNDAIQNALVNEGARIRTADSSCGDVLEALMTNGQRIIIYDGDMNQVDYIPYGALEAIGYKIFGWDGTEYRMDDPELKNKKVVIVPPGQAGEKVKEIIRGIFEK